MSISISRATTLLQTLAAHNVTHVLICPGSRNAPFIYAKKHCDNMTFHSRIDERTAAFTALGMARELGSPVAVITTSGTAISHAYPALLEAESSHIPLLLISADRPSYLKNSGASQTFDQSHLFGRHVKLFTELHELSTDEHTAYETARAVAVAQGFNGQAGPVHINVSFVPPLVPDSSDNSTQPALPTPQCRTAPAVPYHWKPGTKAARGTIVLAADGAEKLARSYAEFYQLPLIADITTDARSSANAANSPAERVTALEEEITDVIMFGKPTLFRSVLALLATKNVTVYSEHLPWNDPSLHAQYIVNSASDLPTFCADPSWLTQWLTPLNFADDSLNHISSARAVWSSSSCARLVVGASNPIRHLTTVATSTPPAERIFSHRGLAGIDGTIAMANGVALASGQHTRLYLGDVTALHDANSLYHAPLEPEYDVHIVLANDGGGTIFQTLEHGKQDNDAALVERFFTTAQNADFAALAQAYGWHYEKVNTLDELEHALARYCGGRVLTEVLLNTCDVQEINIQYQQEVTEQLRRNALN